MQEEGLDKNDDERLILYLKESWDETLSNPNMQRYVPRQSVVNSTYDDTKERSSSVENLNHVNNCTEEASAAVDNPQPGSTASNKHNSVGKDRQ